MSEAKVYIEIAERALLASDGALGKGIHEKAAFLGYHAFESVGGALCTKKGVSYPRNHAKKINNFTIAAKHERYGVQVAQLAIKFASLRNAVLYPVVLSGGAILEPKNFITDTQARRLIGRTDSLVKTIRPQI